MLNKVQLIGRIGNDLELLSTSSGKLYTNINLATTESYNGKNITEWHNVVAWGKLAENCCLFHKKGMLIYVDGSLKTTSDKKNDVTRYFTKINAYSVKFLESIKKDVKNDVDDIPFL